MISKEEITAYYTAAREQIKLNNPVLARKYVLKILNAAACTYYSPNISIVMKAKTAAFLDKWLAVSRDLYSNGITDYVVECFGLTNHLSARLEPSMPQNAPERSKPRVNDSLPDITALLPEMPVESSPRRDFAGVGSGRVDDKPGFGVDVAGIIGEVEGRQGWGAEIFDANKTAVVQITAIASMRVESGTGFIISDKGYLLTNDHVVFDEQSGAYHQKIKMSLAGEKKAHAVEVIISDKKSDVALCRFNPDEVKGFTCIRRIADYSKVKPGADCLIIGNAFGMGLAPCIGNIRFTKNNSNNLVYTSPSNPGDSGGPVFNRAGECIGINKSKTVAVNGTAAEGYANATPMDIIDDLLKKWVEANGIEL